MLVPWPEPRAAPVPDRVSGRYSAGAREVDYGGPVDAFSAAFPEALRSDVAAAVTVVPPSALGPAQAFVARVGGEAVTIPYRIYNPEPARFLTGQQQLVLDCLYSRHHDGRVRQRHLRAVLPAARDWTVPYIVRVLGEYVLEIALDVVEAANRSDELRTALREFGARNPEFVGRTRQQAISYWDAYYRDRCPTPADYPPSALLGELFGNHP